MTPVTTQPQSRILLPDGFVGIRLELLRANSPTAKPIVGGAFRVDRADPSNPPAPRHKAIHAIIQFPFEVDVFRHPTMPPILISPFKDWITLLDDEIESPAFIQGFFAIDVPALMGDDFPKIPFSIFALFGIQASNLLEIS
jgi:hypothetical protein